ncbi:hypothetical protein D9M69_641740 [compost metagenome]
MAPVEKRLTMLETGSTSSSGTTARTPVLNLSNPRRVMRFSDWSSTPRVYCLKMS